MTSSLFIRSDAERAASDPITGLYPYPNRTLAELRADVFSELGFATPTLTGTRTLAQLRTDLMVRLGFAAQLAAPPDGMPALLDSFSNEAQQTLWRRLELDRAGAALPARMVADADPTTLDATAVYNLALAMAKAHYGANDAKLYFEITEKYLKDVAARLPPNATALVNGMLADAQRQLYPRYPQLRKEGWFTWTITAGINQYDPFLQDGASGADTTIYYPGSFRAASAGPGIAHPTLGNLFYYKITSTNVFGESLPSNEIWCSGGLPYPNVLTWAQVPGATGYKIYGRSVRDGELLIATITDPTTTTYSDALASTPAGALPVANTTGGTVNLPLMDPDTIKMGYLVDAAGTWTKLRRGIEPGWYTGARNGRPYAYALRGAIELFPTPDLSTYKLYLYASQGLQAFSADSDVCSVDHEAVFLMALGKALEHYGKNASGTWRQLEVFIGRKVHAGHGGRRYIPNPPAMTRGHVLLGDEAWVQPRGTFR